MQGNNGTPKKTILLVEDRENWRTTFSNLLKNLGYEVLEAACGDEFRNQAIESAVIIILDISMPMKPDGDEIKTTGLDVLLELQRKYPDHHGIQNPIVRSMWRKADFAGTKYETVNVLEDRWCSRDVPSAELIELIESTPGE